MSRLLNACIVTASLTCLPWLAHADALQSLERFMQQAQAGQAQFTQQVTSPSKNGQPARTRTSSGTFEFERPGKFRFDYRKPFEQVIVADGQHLWLHDVDLNQVTQRPQAQALGATPASILASAQDLQGLRKDFELTSAPDADGLEWVQAKPRQRESQLQSVQVGFTPQGTLAALDIWDQFGQRSLIRFEQLQVLPGLPAQTFRFVPPEGADVLKQ